MGIFLLFMVSSGESEFHCQFLTVKNINGGNFHCQLIFFTVSGNFHCQLEIFTVSDIFYCQNVLFFTVKYILNKNELNLIAYEDSSESWLQMKIFFGQKFFWTHVTCQNVPERVALVCVSSSGLQTFQESFYNNYLKTSLLIIFI